MPRPYNATKSHRLGSLKSCPLTVPPLSFCQFCHSTDDCLVQRRHRFVNTKAVESSAVVNSLFPDAVRDQVVGIVEKNNADPSQEFTKAQMGPLRKLHWKDSPNKDAEAASGNKYERLAAQLETSEPVANLYPECTVLFCDIAGFTAWSGKRGPSEVFKLLEAIYGSK